MASVGRLHLATASAIDVCTALQIAREEMIRLMHEERSFTELYLKFLLARSMRTQADLVDQLFNSSERRLARILLILAEFNSTGEREHLIPPITQETLAEMVGTTRSRVSFFMNRFRKLGLIEYNGRIRVHKSLLNVVLLDQFTLRNPERPPGSTTPRIRSKPATRG
jgi:CRP-like cAMP-binding protein